MKRSIYWLAGLTTLLAACNPPAPPAQQPATSALYQVDFQLKDQTTATATMQRVGTKNSAGLSAQELTALPDTLGFNTKPVAVSTFITKKNGVDIRHIHSTFTITNNTTQTINHLMLLPVVRSDADSDPNNNPEIPTVAGTPFLNIRLFDGTDASAQATSIQTTQAQDVDVRTGEAVLNTSASPYLTGLDVSAVTLPATPGMTKTVLDRGWYAARSLAAGASTNVTLAMELPVNPSQPQTQPFSFSIVLTAAQDMSGSSVGAALDPARIQGIIQNWTFGTGENLHASYGGYGTDIPVVSSIAANGAVDGVLTSPGGLSPLFDQSCTFTGEQTASNVNIAVPQLMAISGAGDPLGQVLERTSDGSTVYRVYSDATAQFKGTVTCTYGQNYTIDVKLVRGWNVLSGDFTVNPGRLNNLPAGTKTTLTFNPTRESLGVQFLDSSSFTLSPSQPVTRQVKFIQYGGINGDFTLETSVPGVSVSPSTISLPSLSAASLPGGLAAQGRSLKAQGLNTPVTFTVAEDAKPYNGQFDLIVKQNGVEVGRSTIYSVSVVVPSITTSISQYTYYPYLTLPIGETKTVPVNVTSQNGFSGSTTVTLSPLPDGITASTETVTLTAGSSTQVSISLTATATAAPGSFSTFATGPKVNNFGGYSPPAMVNVVPQRYPIALSTISATAPAANGLWILGKDSAGVWKLLRYLNGNLVQSKTVNTDTYTTVYEVSLLSAPEGDAVTVVYGNESSGGTITNNGYVVTRYNSNDTEITHTMNNLTFASYVGIGVIDASGGLWFSEGYSPSILKRLDMTTGNVEVVESVTGGGLTVAPDGKTLLILSTISYPGILTRLDTTSRASNSVTLSRSISIANPLLADNGGNLYGNEYGSLIKITPDGTVASSTITPYISLNRIYGFDRKQNNVLWVTNSSGMGVIDMNTTAFAQKDSQNVQGGSVDLSGGFWEVLSDSFTGGPYFISRLN